jgi:hypothetical protein
MSGAEQERFHVRMAPGEVKLLTLDQIDDLFRLEVIDPDTLIRQEGTEQWLPLRVVAGLDDDDESGVAASVAEPVRSVPPPPPAPLPPPPRGSLAPPSSATAPFSHSPSFAPPPVASGRPAGFAPSPSASAPPPSFAPPFAPLIAPPAFAAPVPPPRANRVELLLLGVSALLGLLVALERNGALAALSVSAGQSTGYLKLEALLGGPGFGTPRAVEALVSQARSADVAR